MSRNSNIRTENPTTVPGIPAPPSDVSPALRKYLESLTEALEIRLGRRGDPRDRAITLRELINSGLAEELRNKPYNPNKPNDLDFLDPDADLSVPPRPTNFTADGGYSLIQLYWDYPRYGNHSVTEIWRHDSDVIGDAQLVGVASGLAYVDAVGEGADYYYWIRHVSTSGVAGPFNDSAGTRAQTALDVVLLLDTLTGAITEGQLFADLSARIDKIDDPETVVGSVAYNLAQGLATEASNRATAIAAEATARTAAINTATASLQSQIDDLNAIPDWDSTTTYAIDDLVQYNNKLWKALASNSNSTPTTSNSNWQLIGEYTSLGDAVGNNTSDIQQINYVNANSTSAAAVAINSLNTAVYNPTTGLSVTASTLSALKSTVENSTTGLSATVQRVEDLEVIVEDPSTGVEATADAVTLLEGRVTTAEGTITSQSQDITNLENTVNNPTTGVAITASSLNALTSRVSSAEGTISSHSGAITNLENTVDDPVTGVDATSSALSALTSRVSSAEGTIVSQSGSITSLSNSLDDVEGDVSTLQGTVSANSGAISSLDSRVDATEGSIVSISGSITTLTNGLSAANGSISGLSDTVSTLSNSVSDNDGAISANSAAITSINNAINNGTTGLTALANSINSLSNTVTSQGGLISSNSSAITNLQNEIDDPSTGLDATAQAVSTLSGTVSTLNGTVTSISGAVTQLQNKVNDANTGLDAQGDAIDSLEVTVTNQGGTLTALASSVNTLSTTVGNNSAAVSAAAQSIDGLEAKYTVKIDNNGAVAGYGLASTANSAGNIVSEFIVNADRFAILKSASDTGTPNIPFIVQTSTQTINGVTVPPGVYIQDAFVRNGTITNAKIGNAVVDAAKIADLAVTTAKIDNAAIVAAKIQNGEITNAKIANAAITNAKIANAAITTAKIGTAQVDTLQLAGESVIVPVADTYSGYIAPSWPTFRTSANGLPSASITLSLTTEVLILWGVRFAGQASGAGNMILEVYEGGTRLLNIGNTTSNPNAVAIGGFIGGALGRSKAAGTYTYSMRWTAFSSPLYEAYIILLGIQR